MYGKPPTALSVACTVYWRWSRLVWVFMRRVPLLHLCACVSLQWYVTKLQLKGTKTPLWPD